MWYLHNEADQRQKWAKGRVFRRFCWALVARSFGRRRASSTFPGRSAWFHATWGWKNFNQDADARIYRHKVMTRETQPLLDLGMNFGVPGLLDPDINSGNLFFWQGWRWTISTKQTPNLKDKKFPTSVSVQHVEQVYSHWPFHIALVKIHTASFISSSISTSKVRFAYDAAPMYRSMELWSELWKVAGRPFCYETLGESCCHSWTSSRFRFLGNCSHLKRSFIAGQWHVIIHPDDRNSVICPEILVRKVMPQIISIFHKGFHFQLPFLWWCILNRDTATLLDATTLESFPFQPTRSTTRMPSNLVGFS